MFKKNIHYSLYLEETILGACLLEQTAFSRVFGLIDAETFYHPNNKIVYGYMSEMFENNMPITLLSVNDFIQRVKRISKIGDANTAAFLTGLTIKITDTATLEYYSVIIKQMWVDREIITLTSSGVKSEDTRQEMYNLQSKLTELSSNNYSSDWKDMSELMTELYKHQDEMNKSKGMGLKTGFPTIDRLYGGLFGGQTIVIGARPSVGKSALAGQLAMNIAANGSKVGIISMEMKNNEIAARLAAIDTNISFNEIYRGLYADENQREFFYNRVNNTTSALPIFVSDKTDLNVPAIRAKAYKLLHKKGLSCLMIDYLQLVDGDSQSNRNRENEVAKISRGLKIIAKDLNIPVIILCQLNREVEKRKGKDRFPQLSDFRESGAIEQDADAAMFLHSDYMSGVPEDENNNSTENVRQLVIRKWRNGVPNIIINLEFDGPKMSMREKLNTWVPVKRATNYYEKNNDESPF